jgi:D-arginine dehydrogenase
VVASALGVSPVGLRPLRRTVAIVSSDQVRRDWPFVGEVHDAFYFRPEGDALLLSPADETPSAPVDARAETEDVALALDRANEATTLNLRHVRTAWAGLRTFAPDRNPVVGSDPAQAGFFWLAGQGGYGMQTAPALSRLAAALVRGEAVPADLTAQGLDFARLAPGRLTTVTG